MPATRTLPPFNNGRPLRVVRLPSEGDADRLGVVDEAHLKVWIETDVASTWMHDIRSLEEVPLPTLPSHYGSWVKKSIGGVSSTVRRVGVLRGTPGKSPPGKSPVTLFAVHAPSPNAVSDALADTEAVISVGDTEHDDEYGHVTEVVVHDSEDVAYAASVIARTGATPIMEKPEDNAKRCLGIERLDRIHSRVVVDETMDEEEAYGLRRGSENWRFPWMPGHWRAVPITWDHMVANVCHETLEDLPQPLRQHVARAKLEAQDFAPLGTKWTLADPPTPQEQELAPHAPPPLRKVIADAPSALLDALSEDRLDVSLAELEGFDVQVDHLVQARDGRWFRPCDTKRALLKHIPAKRLVSAALSEAQSKQLVDAFFALVVERVSDPETKRALSLVLYHYMKERGYTARWLGKYEQEAKHIGNGDSFRRFGRLAQYAPHRLPADVLNKLCGRDGRLKNRGSKGSRSKYKQVGKKRYKPKRRLLRTREEEWRMVAPADGTF